MKVTREQIQTARKANLFNFLCTHHADEVETDRNGKTLRLSKNHSISIKADYSGFLDFASGEKTSDMIFSRQFSPYVEIIIIFFFHLRPQRPRK